jgi:hypothetical protein
VPDLPSTLELDGRAEERRGSASLSTKPTKHTLATGCSNWPTAKTAFA